MTARRLETRLHPDDRIDPGKPGPQVMRHVTVNVGESPIGWLASRGLLTAAQLGEISPELGPAVLDVLTVHGSIDARSGRGGTATARVREQMGELAGEGKAHRV